MKERIRRINLSLVVALFAASCSPSVVGIYNTGIVKKQPNTFYVYSPDEAKALSEKEKLFNEQLVSIIKEVLESKNLSYSSLPDLYVSYMINVHRTQETNQTNYNQFDQNQYYNSLLYLIDLIELFYFL